MYNAILDMVVVPEDLYNSRRNVYDRWKRPNIRCGGPFSD